MEIPSADITRPEAGHGPGALLSRFFAWKHLVLVGAACLLAFTLLGYQYIAIVRTLTLYVLLPLSFLLFGMMIWQERLLRYPEMKLLLAVLVWLSAVYILNARRADAGSALVYYSVFCSIAILCFPLAYVAAPERRQRTFDLMAAVWSVPVACSSVAGIALTLSGKVFYRAADAAPLGIVDGRLFLVCDPNTYGVLCCMALCLILYLLLGKRKPAVRALLIIAGLCLLTAIALTDSRGARLALLPAAFFFAAIIVRRLMRHKKKALRLLAAALAGLAFCAVLLVGCRALAVGVNALRTGGAPMQEIAPAQGSASADADTPEAVLARGISETSTISLRLEMWRYALGRLPAEKDVLLRGATPALVHTLFMDPAEGFNHLHNAYLSVLLSYGIPGFLLMAAFLVYLAVCAVRLLFSGRSDLPDAIRFLPVLLLPILAINLMEELLFTLSFPGELDFWLAIIGGYTAVLAREWRVPRTADAASEPPVRL